jgi:hypothetical protein
VIEADLVVIGIGVRPLIDLAERADIGHVDERVTLYCKTLPHYPQSFIPSGFSNPHLPQRMVALLSLRSDAQFVEQRLSVLQVGGIEAFGEPAVDLGEHCSGFYLSVLKL